MKKIFIILTTILIFFGCSLPVFAVNGITIDSYLSEPVPSDSVAYFAIGSSASDARLYSIFINPDHGKIRVEQNFVDGKYCFDVYCILPDGSFEHNFPCWVGRYNLIDGTCYALNHYGVSDMTVNYQHHLVLSSESTYTNKPYYWYSGNVTCENYNTYLPDSNIKPSLMHISWNGTGQALLDIKGQIQAIQLVMSSLYNRVDLTYQDVDAMLQLLSDHYDWFENTYYNAILDHWDFTNEYLYDIYNYLINSNGETLPDQSQNQSDVNGFIQDEHQYIDEFDSQLNGIQNSFDQASSNLNSFSSAFAFIGYVFNSFIPSGSLPYIFIFMSLTFGLIVLILGKQRS